ncbi:hypothetical protein CNEO4_1760008 [Clostridium neonatale]|uniref:Uncharacterized protein n=1 Tax=Clostridium neonatale TaxID=137838 RepID=A0AA86JCM4_9CLOT|nr:hypothetical protein CNEO_40200 [Clostridium neonatale]CAG9712048.1 hypothetical protein CNEO_1590009 [Clostridium neonatale]CAI3195881.1 hypothetical protein CNEO2_1390005 [Clostridium neonatale]CAI3201130.1 hypothetical protein CNEO2_230005 [Clostridium neonatale]CAI3220990.1 hypothetical protein CNEO2_130073 [Clostridium neonatale]
MVMINNILAHEHETVALRNVITMNILLKFKCSIIHSII